MDSRTTRMAGIGLALTLAAACAVPAAAVDLAPHRAFYTLKLVSTRGGGIIDVRGVTVMSLEKTCDGWIIGHRMSADLDAGRVTLKQETRFTAWESADGHAYRFAARNQLGDSSKTFRGEARAGGADRGSLAAFTIPAGRTLPLPPETMFPVGHLEVLIARAAAGDRRVSRILFDGNDGQGPRLVVAFVGPRVDPDQAAATRLGPLAARPGWSVRLAFYPVDSQAPVPEYEIQAVQLDNGVADHLILDYGDFTLRLDLEKVEAVPAPVC